MNSKGHLFISLAKSSVRILGCILGVMYGSFIPLAVCFGLAEVGGIAEELVDRR